MQLKSPSISRDIVPRNGVKNEYSKYFFFLSLSSVFSKSYLFPDSLRQSLKPMADFSVRWVLDQWTGLFPWFKDFRTSSSTRTLSFKESGNPLQCSCLEKPRDGGAWWAAVYGVAQSRTWLKWLSSSSNRGNIMKILNVQWLQRVFLSCYLIRVFIDKFYSCAIFINVAISTRELLYYILLNWFESSQIFLSHTLRNIFHWSTGMKCCLHFFY